MFLHLSNADPYFRDVTDAMKLDFRHVNGFSAERRLVETMGSGGALFDFDNDDDLDLYLIQGNSLSLSAEPLPKNRLYRNDAGIFVDITASANVGDTGYGLGAVAADYNSDGYRDLYVTNLGKKRSIPQQWRWHVYRCNRASTGGMSVVKCKCGVC